MVKFGGIFVLFLTIFVQSGLALVCYDCKSTGSCGLQYNETTNKFPEKTCAPATTECITQLYEVKTTGDNDKPGTHTIRGCKEDLIEGVCDSNLEKCRLCTGNKCNNEALGPVRTECKKCSGIDGCKTSVESLCDILPGFTAPFTFEQSCITLFDKDGKVTGRGCYGDYPMINRNQCNDTNNVNCIKCKEKNCNTHLERNANKCYRCSGQECVTPSKTHEVLCSKGTETENLSIDCYVGTSGDSGQVVRDCKQTIKSGVDFAKCSTLENQNENSTCVICSSELCNGQTFPIKKQLSCYTCKGANCPAKPDDPTAVSQTCDSSIPNQECVTVFSDTDGKVIERGCSSSLTDKCDTNICRRCSDNKCNTQITQSIQCLSCKSNESSNCVYDTSSTGLQTIPCDRYCYMRNEGTILSRGCLTKTETCAADTCKSCDSNNCNKGIFPADRLSCYRCNGNDCVNNQKKEPCLKYLKDDQCFSLFNEYNIARKGCKSELTTTELEKCPGNSTTCNLCNGTNCNAYNTRADEKCIICNSRTNPECAQRPSNLNPTQCVKKSDGKCFTALTGMYIFRECSSEINTEGILQNLTESCFGAGCNNKIYPENRLKCYHCDSNKDDACKNEQTDTTKIIPCVNYQKDDQCFSIINDADEFHRGCTSSVVDDVCGKTKKCKKCSGNACNSISEKSLNSSAMLKVNAFVILILLLITSRLR